MPEKKEEERKLKEGQRDTAEGRITPEGIAAVRRRIGIHTPWDRPGHEYATMDGIRCYAEGIGDKNPFYRFPEVAANSRWKTMIAHPTMMLYMGVSEKKELTPEERERGRGGGLAGVHEMYSGQELEWYRPIYAGDRLWVTGGLATVEEKKSEFAGNTLLTATERVFWNQRQELVGVTRNFGIRTERTKAREKRKYLDIPIQTYKEGDIAKIDADYEREYIRGAEPRYWEDVTIGEESVPVVKGPWKVTDYIVFAEATGHRNDFHRSHSLAYEYRKRHPGAFPLNEYGFPDVIMRVHWDPLMARTTGVHQVYDFGGERIAWLSHAITNWMGNDGFLRKLSIQIRRFCVLGDCQWIKAKVTDKGITDGEYWVDLDVWAENQRQENTAPSKARVLLPSKVAGPVKIPVRIPEEPSIYAPKHMR